MISCLWATKLLWLDRSPSPSTWICCAVWLSLGNQTMTLGSQHECHLNHDPSSPLITFATWSSTQHLYTGHETQIGFSTCQPGPQSFPVLSLLIVWLVHLPTGWHCIVWLSCVSKHRDRNVNVMRWLRQFYFICFIVFISLVIPCLQVTQVILSFSLHLIFGLIGSYLIWRLYSILEGHLPSYWYLVLWTLL